MPPDPAAGSDTFARLDSSSSTSCVLRATQRPNASGTPKASVYAITVLPLPPPSPQQTQRAEFCQRQKLVGIGGKPRIDHALGIFERDTGTLDGAQISDARGQHERQFLHFRSARVMDHPSIGNRERTLESHARKAFDRAGERGHDLGPGIGTGSPYRAGADRVETETNIAGREVKAFALRVFGNVGRSHARLRTDLKFD